MPGWSCSQLAKLTVLRAEVVRNARLVTFFLWDLFKIVILVLAVCQLGGGGGERMIKKNVRTMKIIWLILFLYDPANIPMLFITNGHLVLVTKFL